MSLVHSLLALSALLAAANAVIPPPCSNLNLGKLDGLAINLPQNEIPGPGTQTDDQTKVCPRQGLHLVGLSVEACNGKGVGGFPPVVYAPANQLSPFAVWCPDCTKNIKVNVTVYCG